MRVNNIKNKISNIKPGSKREAIISAIIVTFSFVLIISAFSFLYRVNEKEKNYDGFNVANYQDSIATSSVAQNKYFIEEYINEEKISFPQIAIEGQAAYVFDIENQKVLFNKNPNSQLPLASLTKVMTAFTVLNTNKKTDLVRIENSHLETGSFTSLIPGEHFRLSDLIDYTLTTSSNGGAMALASLSGDTNDFVYKMNQLSKKIGMKNTYFLNPTGLDELNTNKPGATGSAKDITILFEHVLKNNPELFESTNKTDFETISKEGYVHDTYNTNKIINKLPNALASKTGYTDLAGGNLAVVINPSLNNPIVIVVLGSSKEGRFRDVSRLSDATLDYLALNN